MQPDGLQPFWRNQGLLSLLPTVWRDALIQLAIAWIALFALAAREWSEMFHQYWNIDTYNHILLVPPIIAWLVTIRAEVLAKLAPRLWSPALGLVAIALAVWIAGRISGINLLAHAGAVGALQAAVVLVLGPRVSLAIVLPLGFMAFLVPFGDEIIPQLQMITAQIAISLTEWSGIPAEIDGIYIDTPVGLFIVAEACSGVKFLVAMVTLGVLVCFTAFESWKKRSLFMLACIVVPVIANGIRAWGTIYIAQSQGVEFAEGFDHIFYGWVFFAIVVAIILAGAWRHFEREPEDAGYLPEQIERLPVVGKIPDRASTLAGAMGGFVALLLIFLLLSIYAPASV